MRNRSRLAWKLSAAVVAILTVVIVLSEYANNFIYTHYSVESARNTLRSDSEMMAGEIGRKMAAGRHDEGIERLIVEAFRDSTVYGDIRLLSHRAGREGEVVASRLGKDNGRRLELADRVCVACHNQDDLSGAGAEIVDMEIDFPGGNRVLSVMAPINNGPGCRSADCHVHAADSPILGFVNADQSLHHVDSMATQRWTLIVATVLASVMLGVVALRFMLVRFMERPINELIAGTQRIASGQFDYRFDQKRDDEIGALEESFNAMAAKIQNHRDELRNTMEYLGEIIESSADIIITVTLEGFIETFNRGAELALGYSRAEVIGQRIESLFVDPREREIAIARLKDTDSVKNFETRLLTKDRHVRHVLLTLSYLRDREGRPIGTFGISKDVTQERELQRELVQSQKFAAIGQAVTGIQHGIKNMLNSLKGGAYLVRKGAAKEDLDQIKEGSGMLEDGIELIAALSQHMLDYAKEWKPQLQRVDVGGLLKKVCELNQRTAADRRVALRSEVQSGLPAVLCDPKLIHLATTDILVNAIDACAWKEYGPGESPEIVLRNYMPPGGDVLVIEVRDNGCGMTKEIRQNIFTPFFSTKRSRGSGLGLALTARIINVHGGKVDVESEAERGAVFRIRLPIDGPEDNREAVDGQAGSRS